jgi:NTP pyrophosphatase (non-canonical NTP hydrolase)
MTINEYQQAALRTESGMSKQYPRILNGLMGLNGEAGEAIDILKKHFFQGHEFDQEHMAKELGDIAWYLAISADAIGYDLETIDECLEHPINLNSHKPVCYESTK